MKNGADINMQAIIDEFQNWRFEEFPEYATLADFHLYNDRLETLTLEKCEKRLLKCKTILDRLYSIEKDLLSDTEIANFDLLEDFLKTYIEGYEWRFHATCNSVNFLENILVNFKSVLIGATPFHNLKDFTNYLRRLDCIATKVSEQIDLMEQAVLHKTTLHRVSVEKVLIQLQECLEKDIEQNMFYLPAKSKFSELPDNERNESLLKLFETAIKKFVKPALKKLKEFIENKYLPVSSSMFYGFNF